MLAHLPAWKLVHMAATSSVQLAASVVKDITWWWLLLAAGQQPASKQHSHTKRPACSA